MFRNEKTYYFLRFVSWVIIPLSSLVWYVISGLMHQRTPQALVGVVIGLAAYLGLTLQISTARFKRESNKAQGGVIKIAEIGNKKVFSLELEGNPAELEDKQEVLFKVNVRKAEDET